LDGRLLPHPPLPMARPDRLGADSRPPACQVWWAGVPPVSWPALRQGGSPVRKPVLRCAAGFLTGAVVRGITG